MEHHERAIERYVADVSADPEVLAVIVSGSVARGPNGRTPTSTCTWSSRSRAGTRRSPRAA
ncbi:hypothetical protein [Leifsonia sp. P73]|uniref:hypothetical protein n=1 Tax=Leifsonia sp. P73 TaxID=3423959 RepID=UPI003DA5B666